MVLDLFFNSEDNYQQWACAHFIKVIQAGSKNPICYFLTSDL